VQISANKKSVIFTLRQSLDCLFFDYNLSWCFKNKKSNSSFFLFEALIWHGSSVSKLNFIAIFTVNSGI
jgi:hypothetical protein